MAEMRCFINGGSARGQTSIEWLLGMLFLALCGSALMRPSLAIGHSAVFAYSNLESAAYLSDSALLAHSGMFGVFSGTIAPQGNFSAYGRCISLPQSPACQPMARGVYVDRGAMKYEGIGYEEPV